MLSWAILIGGSIFTGSLVATYVKHRYAIILSGFLPWSFFLGVILYTEYFVAYQGGVASMWPVAQLIGVQSQQLLVFLYLKL